MIAQLTRLGVFVSVVAFAVGQVSAEEADLASLQRQLNAQNSRIMQLEGELAAQGCGVGCDDGCGSGLCASACGCPGWIAGLDATVLRPHVGTLTYSLPGSIGPVPASGSVTPGFDYEISPRFHLGYKTASGLGMRARYWYFDHSSSGSSVWEDTGLADLDLGLEAQTVDLEVMQDGMFQHWSFEVAGGIRYGMMDLGATVADLGGTLLGQGGFRFEGFGPTVAMAMRRPLGNSEFALIGNARGSFLYGTTKFDIGIDAISFPLGFVNLDTEEHMMQVWEFQLGGEWARERSDGSRIFVQTLYEGQAWEWAPTLGLGGLDIGFTGFTCRIGIDR